MNIDVTETKEAGQGSYKCSVCGYVFPGSREEFEQLPDDYICPTCGVDKSMFELL